MPKDLIVGVYIIYKFVNCGLLQGVLLWQEYQTLRFKIWGTKVCHHSHESK